MAKPWPYRPDFTPTAALSVSHPTYLYQYCTRIIISIKFSTTTGRKISLHKTQAIQQVCINYFGKKNPNKIWETSHGKISHPCFGLFQWNIRINFVKQRLPTINENQSFHSPLWPGLLVPGPFPCVDTHVNDQAFNHIGKLIVLHNKAKGEKSQACSTPQSDTLHDHQGSRWPGHRCWQSNNLTKASQAED